MLCATKKAPLAGNGLAGGEINPAKRARNHIYRLDRRHRVLPPARATLGAKPAHALQRNACTDNGENQEKKFAHAVSKNGSEAPNRQQ